MQIQNHNQIVSFIWGIANDCLRDVYVRGKYRDVILPMTVIRRLDAVLEPTKDDVLEMKETLDEAGVIEQTSALKHAAKQEFYNNSPFVLKDLTAYSNKQQLKDDFIAYLGGFSPNVQDILLRFRFYEQIDLMTDADILGAIIEKFVDPRINLSPHPVMEDNGDVRLPGLDNHTMGVIFEELIRRFNEENNEEAGEHFTPRDVVTLMADLVFLPIKDQIEDSTYTCYDGACGTGGMLTIADERLRELAQRKGRNVSIHLFGQESQSETYAIAKADLLIKGDGRAADNIEFGSTISNDKHAGKEFDFMLSNPPYGKSWSIDANRMGGRNNITDPRFVTSFKDEPEFRMIPRVSDGQMLFLLNNMAKMKRSTKLGSRIAHVHNGSSLFTGEAGSGESNIRRYIIENDYLEAIIALPESMFYNTDIATYIWVLTNRKSKERQGKVQLIDASRLKSPLRKNLGKKSVQLTPEIREQIVDIYLAFEENRYSKIFDNKEFGYWEVTVERPVCLKATINQELVGSFAKVASEEEGLHKVMELTYQQVGDQTYTNYGDFEEAFTPIAREQGVRLYQRRKRLIESHFAEASDKAEPVVAKTISKGTPNPIYGQFEHNGKVVEFEPDTDLRDTERIPLLYPGGIEAFFKEEVLPYAPTAWIDKDKTRVGYEISFTKYFYEPVQLRSVVQIAKDLQELEQQSEGLLREILEGIAHG